MKMIVGKTFVDIDGKKTENRLENCSGRNQNEQAGKDKTRTS